MEEMEPSDSYSLLPGRNDWADRSPASNNGRPSPEHPDQCQTLTKALANGINNPWSHLNLSINTRGCLLTV